MLDKNDRIPKTIFWTVFVYTLFTQCIVSMYFYPTLSDQLDNTVSCSDSFLSVTSEIYYDIEADHKDLEMSLFELSVTEILNRYLVNIQFSANYIKFINLIFFVSTVLMVWS